MARLQVTNISPEVDERSLRDFFAFCGAIDRVEFALDHSDTKADSAASADSAAVITFENPESVQMALLLQRWHPARLSKPAIAGTLT